MINKTNKYRKFEDLPVWEMAHNMTLKIYKESRNFPKSEIYGLTSQLRRSSSSIGANIAEGFCRNSTKELIQFLYNARGSCSETAYHLRLAGDLNYLNNGVFKELSSMSEEIGKQLSGWISSLKSRLN